MYIENPHPRLLQETPTGIIYVDILAYLNGGFVITDEHYLYGPGVTVKPLPEALTQPIITPRMQIMHTQAANRKATNDQAWNYARNLSTGEANVYGPDMLTGAIIQAMPFNRRADSNYKVNMFALGGISNYGAASWETQDEGSASLRNTNWSLPQLETMTCGLTAYCFVYRTACTMCGHARDTGIAPHVLFANDKNYPWSKDGHTCPEAARVRQLPFLLGKVAERLAGIYAAVGESCST
jgi:hypothetical protein